ncbi:PREDICTED: uncharacterized protein At4g04775-like [Tarenaya hassleriana]|uniref:uncharacterized protein At4g04775-like n=1 Tax=Tarenaya hassleriana TaxID=28532 RepID=UPI00053C7B32|nr:PREDICTED: uncharacterized protein At4g04775-like [Tarenaya hassleriana]
MSSTNSQVCCSPRSSKQKGLPQQCECGRQIIKLISKTSKNPGRLFFCCESQEGNYSHVWKWVDEAIIEELQSLKEEIKVRNEKIEVRNEKIEVQNEKIEFRNDKIEVQNEKMKVRIDMIEARLKRIEAEVQEFKAICQKMLIGMVVFISVGLYYYGLLKE